MLRKSLLTIALTLTFTAHAAAALRTIDIDNTSPANATEPGLDGFGLFIVGADNTFEFTPGAFVDNIAVGAELTDVFSVVSEDSSLPPYTLTSIERGSGGTGDWTFDFGGGSFQIFLQSNGELSGTDLPDGVFGPSVGLPPATRWGTPGGFGLGEGARISIATVPEPAAFGIAVVALAAVGLGTWRRHLPRQK